MTARWRKLWERELGSTVPSYRFLVADSVSESVTRAWKARGYELASTSGSTKALGPLMHRNVLASRAVFIGTTTVGGIVTGGLAFLTGVASLIVGDLVDPGVIITGLSAAGTLGTSGYTGARYLRDPKRLNKKALEDSQNAMWLTPQALGYSFGRQDTDEQRLFHLTVHIAQQISRTPAWNDPVLEDHVSHIDLDHAVSTIGVRLQEIYLLRSELESLRDKRTAPQIDAYQEQLAAAFRSIADRVTAMHDYLGGLGRLSVKLGELQRSEQSREIGERVLDVVARTAADDAALTNLEHLGLAADSHVESIQQLLGELESSAAEFSGEAEAVKLDRELDR